MFIPLVIVFMGIRSYYKNKQPDDPFSVTKKKIFERVLALIVACIAMVFFLFVLGLRLTDYARTKEIYDSRLYQSVEGTAENYHPMLAGDHGTENFDVKGVDFAYSDADISDYGYNTPASHGGAITEGRYVRIGFFYNGYKNVIRNLETR